VVGDDRSRTTLECARREHERRPPMVSVRFALRARARAPRWSGTLRSGSGRDGRVRAANRGGRWVLTSGSHSARCGTGQMRRGFIKWLKIRRKRSAAARARPLLVVLSPCSIEGLHRPLPGFSCASSPPLEQGRCSRSPLAAPRELRDSGRGPRPMPPTRPISTGRLDAETTLAAARSFRTTRPTRTPARTPRCWRAAAEFAAPWLFPTLATEETPPHRSRMPASRTGRERTPTRTTLPSTRPKTRAFATPAASSFTSTSDP
jgi:hypothetical protein